MNIKDLEPRQGDVDIVVDIVSIEAPREFQKFGKPGKVANAIIKDSTGEMKLTLWNEQIDKVKLGDKIHIQKGYVNEWQGEKQLTTGKFGTLDILESKATISEPQQAQPAPPQKEKTPPVVKEESPAEPEEEKGEEKAISEDDTDTDVEEEEIK
ncbi:MAG: hypothetical protein KJ574_00755 [Nanoarchaeota archaeon]|nr:hypothetical protein [Nanoarchaeota archaeon]